jgi:histidine ammonia-lyase
MQTYKISPEPITLQELADVVHGNSQVVLSETSEVKIKKCRDFLDEVVKNNDKPIYGINTGFGSLYKNSIGSEHLETLQRNLVVSHACGMGASVPQEIVRWMLILKARGLSYGHSGVQLETVKRLLDFYNNGYHPEIFEQGSLGASGDLAPLAHLALPLIGEGKVNHNGKLLDTQTVLNKNGWTPITLRAKEGLALLNGTQFMSAYACYLVDQSRRLLKWANTIGAMSLEAYNGRPEPFGAPVNEIRKQLGQISVAKSMRELLAGSEMQQQPKPHVQDPYSFRCIPQVHGATMDVLQYVTDIVEREINAVTDNPTIFPDTGEIVSAGNFHGQPLALALDHLAVAMAEIGSISERRTYKLLSGSRELPEFLVNNPGLNSGFMIAQYAGASIVSQNKQLCVPASVDTIDSSNGQEDHVSMGANAATKAYRVIQNVQQVLGIELMHAAQALEFKRPLKSSASVESLHSAFRKIVPFIENDTYMHPHLKKAGEFLDANPF